MNLSALVYPQTDHRSQSPWTMHIKISDTSHAETYTYEQIRALTSQEINQRMGQGPYILKSIPTKRPETQSMGHKPKTPQTPHMLGQRKTGQNLAPWDTEPQTDPRPYTVDKHTKKQTITAWDIQLQGITHPDVHPQTNLTSWDTDHQIDERLHTLGHTPTDSRACKLEIHTELDERPLIPRYKPQKRSEYSGLSTIHPESQHRPHILRHPQNSRERTPWDVRIPAKGSDTAHPATYIKKKKDQRDTHSRKYTSKS